MVANTTNYTEKYINKIAEKENISKEKAKKEIEQTDKLRANNYQYYTHQIWGLSSNYNLCIDTSLGNDYVDSLILKAIEDIKNK